MPTKLPLSNRCRGFTLIEALVALVILTIAVLGISVAVGVQSGGTAKSLSFGLGAISRAGSLSTATFLAQDRLEQVKRVQYKVGAADPFAPGNPPPGFADESPVNGFPNFNRQVRVVAGPAAATRRVTVTVFFNASGDDGIHQESVAVSTLMAARP
jgi:prepilin-type N-terminal cleavage/methylation domain-containing protein